MYIISNLVKRPPLPVWGVGGGGVLGGPLPVAADRHQAGRDSDTQTEIVRYIARYSERWRGIENGSVCVLGGVCIIMCVRWRVCVCVGGMCVVCVCVYVGI